MAGSTFRKMVFGFGDMRTMDVRGRLANNTGSDIYFYMEWIKGGSYPKGYATNSKNIKWTARLQRRNATTNAYETIGTRTGYINKNSPSARTFTNVKKTGRQLRVEVTCGPRNSVDVTNSFVY